MDNNNKEQKVEFPIINYYIIEKDRVLIEKIKSALSNDRYKCLGVCVASKNIQLEFQKLTSLPNMFFVGNIDSISETITYISKNYSNSRLLRIYSKAQISKTDVYSSASKIEGSFLII